MQQGPVKSFLLSQNCQIEFVFNPPSASHFGGVFERQIGSIRKVLSGLLLEQRSSLSDECLPTLLYEVSAIINCRPLSHGNLSHSCIEPLSPNHLLAQKSRVVVSPPGTFTARSVSFKAMASCAIFGKHFLDSMASGVPGFDQQTPKVDDSTTQHRSQRHREIGRASCRERV